MFFGSVKNEMFFLFLQINRSSPQKVHLKSARWSTAGKFRCEVTADDFETASKSGDATVVGKLLANLPYQIALCPIHVVTFTLISNLATDYIQKRRGEPCLFSFE